MMVTQEYMRKGLLTLCAILLSTCTLCASVLDLMDHLEDNPDKIPEELRKMANTMSAAKYAEAIELCLKPELVAYDMEAVSEIIFLSSPRLIDKDLKSLLSHESPISRYCGLLYIQSLPLKKSRELLLGLVKSPHDELKTRALWELRRHADKTCRDILEAHLSHRDIALAAAARAALRYQADFKDPKSPQARTLKAYHFKRDPKVIETPEVFALEVDEKTLSPENLAFVINQVNRGAHLRMRGHIGQRAVKLLKAIGIENIPLIEKESIQARLQWQRYHPLQDFIISGDRGRIGLTQGTKSKELPTLISASSKRRIARADSAFKNWDKSRWIAPMVGLEKPELAPLLVHEARGKRGRVVLEIWTRDNRLWEWEQNIRAYVFGYRSIKLGIYVAEFNTYVETDHFKTLSTEVVTPHFKWGKPLAGGPLATSFFVADRQLRPCIEIMQRIDVTPSFHQLGSVNFGTPQKGNAKKRRGAPISDAVSQHRFLAHLSSKPSLLVCSGLFEHPRGTGAVEGVFNLAAMKPHTTWRIFQEVREGMGLVVLGEHAFPAAYARTLKKHRVEAPQALIDASAQDAQGCAKLVDCYEVEGGRIVVLKPRYHYLGFNYPLPATLKSPLLSGEAHYAINSREYAYSLAAAAMLWASKRQGQKVSKQSVTYRNRFGRSGTAAQIPTPRVCETRLLNTKGEVLGWSAKVEDQSLKTRLTLTPDKRVVIRGDHINIEARTSTPVKGRLDIEVEDVHGRVVARQSIDFNNKATIKVEIDWEHLSRLHDINARLMQGETSIAEDRTSFVINRMREKPGMQFLIAPTSHNFLPGFEALGIPMATLDARFTTQSHINEIFEKALRHNVQPQGSYSTIGDPFGADGAWNDGARSACFSDPSMWATHRGDIIAKAKNFHLYGLNRYFVKDEFTLGGPFCFSKHCLNRFAHEMQAKYGSLDKLNARWKTSFKSWDKLQPDKLGVALRNKNLASWMEHREFMDRRVAYWVSETEKLMRQEIHPLAKTGLSSYYHPNPTQGMNNALVSRAGSVVCNHRNNYNVNGVRDFGMDGLIFSRWFVSPYSIRRAQSGFALYELGWYLMEQSSDIYSWWGYTHWAYPFIKPDLTLATFLRPFHKEYQLYKRGLDRMILEADLDNREIAALYSQPSIRMTHALAKQVKGKTLYWHSKDRFLDLMAEGSYQGHVVPYLDLDDKSWDFRGVKIFSLTGCASLSKPAIEHLGAYVKAGGVLVCDLLPLYDELGFRHSGEIIKNLYGVSSKYRAKAVDKDSTHSLAADIHKGKVDIKNLDTSLKLAGAEATGKVGNTPAITQHRLGKGHVILLNFSLREINHDKAFKKSLRDHLAKLANIGTPYLAEVEAKAPRHVKLRAYRDKHAKYISLQIPGPQRQEKARNHRVRVRLPSEFHVYDMRRSRYVDKTRSLNLDVEENIAQYFALLPEKLPQFQILDATIKANEIHIPTQLGKYRRVVDVNVSDPQGKTRKVLNRQISGSGKTRISIPLAHSDPKGKWKVRVFDVVSGLEKTVEVDR